MGVKRKVTVTGSANAISIGEAFEEFIAEKTTQGIVDKTIRNYTQAYQYFLELELDEDDDFNISDLGKIYVQQWVEAMIAKRMKVTTINSYLRIMRVFLYWCMSEERLYIEPSYKINLVKGQEPLPKIFTDEEIAILIQKPTRVKDFVEWRNWAIVNWIMATGNRASTICEIKIGDVDFENYQISLRHTKNKKAQILPLSASLAGILKTYIKACRRGEKGNAWLFPSVSNEKLTYNALAHSFGRYCKERGVAHTNIHGLRHYFATQWIKNGGSGDKLQRTLGHSTYDMTQRYVKLTDNDLRNDYDKFTPLDNMNKAKQRRKKVEMN